MGNDGGHYASANGGSSWTHSNDEPWSQYVSVDVSEQDPTRFLGGLHGCYQYGNCTGFSGGSQFNLPITSDRFPFFIQLELQPGNPDVLYSGGNKLNRSHNGGRSFAVLTDDLGHGGSTHGGYAFGTISAIGLSASESNVVWVGTDNGYLYRSTDRGNTVTDVDLGIKPRTWITRITVDPADSSSVYVTLSGYRSGDNQPYILHSADAGDTWTDTSANLPKAPVNELLVVDKTLYVGTDVGVFTSPVSAPSWKSVGKGIPQQTITDLRYVPTNKTLYAATFGEGVWSVPR